MQQITETEIVFIYLKEKYHCFLFSVSLDLFFLSNHRGTFEKQHEKLVLLVKRQSSYSILFGFAQSGNLPYIFFIANAPVCCKNSLLLRDRIHVFDVIVFTTGTNRQIEHVCFVDKKNFVNASKYCLFLQAWIRYQWTILGGRFEFLADISQKIRFNDQVLVT